MGLERKDVRAKLDHDDHAALVVICDADGIEIAAFIEQELLRVIRKRVHTANVISAGTADLGISGISRSPPGKP